MASLISSISFLFFLFLWSLILLLFQFFSFFIYRFFELLHICTRRREYLFLSLSVLFFIVIRSYFSCQLPKCLLEVCPLSLRYLMIKLAWACWAHIWKRLFIQWLCAGKKGFSVRHFWQPSSFMMHCFHLNFFTRSLMGRGLFRRRPPIHHYHHHQFSSQRGQNQGFQSWCFPPLLVIYFNCAVFYTETHS